MAKDEEDKKPDILDDIKRIDRAVRAKTLANVLSTLKEKAHEVLLLKEQTNMLLEAVGVSAEDAKRIIDFVNSLDDVQLSESEKQNLREDTREEVSEVKKKAEKKVNEAPTVMSGSVVPAVLTTTSGVSTAGWPAAYGSISENAKWDNRIGYYNASNANSFSKLNTVGYTANSSANTVTLSSGTSKLALKM
jgi:hypothetical protein